MQYVKSNTRVSEILPVKNWNNQIFSVKVLERFVSMFYPASKYLLAPSSWSNDLFYSVVPALFHRRGTGNYLLDDSFVGIYEASHIIQVWSVETSCLISIAHWLIDFYRGTIFVRGSLMLLTFKQLTQFCFFVFFLFEDLVFMTWSLPEKVGRQNIGPFIVDSWRNFGLCCPFSEPQFMLR